MKNKTIKLLSSVLVATMLTTAGCGAESAATAEPAAESKEEAVAESAEPAAAEEAAAEEDGYAYEKNTDPATVSIYIDSPGTLWETWGSDPVSQRVTDLTGISFECVAPVTDDDTKLTLLISSDDLPDIVTAGASDPAWETMVSNGMLADLEELAAQYAPKLLTELVDDEVWEFCREEDGKVYSLISCYNTSETLEWLEKYNYLIATNQPVILIRQDYYEEIGSPEITSADEFMAACEQIKEKHPDTIPFYSGGLTASGPSYLRYLFGVGSYYVDEEGSVSMSYRNPEYLEMYKWVNQMVQKGLMTEDSFVDGSEEKNSKSLAGEVATYVWTIGETGKVPADNPDTSYYPMKPWDSYEQVRTNTGYLRFAISAKSDNQEAATRWFEFANSELGARTICWGIEGEEGAEWSGDVVNGPHSYTDADGKVTYYQGFQEARNNDWSGVEKQSGLGFYQSYCLTNNVYNMTGEVMQSDLMTEMNEWYGDKISYNNGFVFNLPAGSDEYVTYQTITSLISEYNVKWAFAADEAELESLYNEFLEKAEAAGEAKLNEWYTATYKENISK